MSGTSAPSASSKLLIPSWQMLYGSTQQDITAVMKENWKETIYEELIGGKACTLHIYFSDTPHTFMVTPPTKGSLVSVSIGYVGQPLVKAGSFEVDEYELEGPPTIFLLKCIEAGMSQGMRTLNSVSYEGRTLSQIATTVANKYGFTVSTAAVNPDVRYDYLSQNMESDLAFLHRIANQHGYDFQIRDKNMVFYSRTAIESAAVSGTVDLHSGKVKRFRLRDQSLGHRTFKAAQVVHYDPQVKGIWSSTSEDDTQASGDTLKSSERVENGQQASVKSDAYLHAHNMLGQMAELTIIGTMDYRAGQIIAVKNFGVFDLYSWIIEKAYHVVNRSGYLTRLTLRTKLTGKKAKGSPAVYDKPGPNDFPTGE